MGNDARITLGLSGAQSVQSDLEKVKGAFKSVKGELSGMALDALRVATAIKTINFAAAAEQAKQYDLTLARMTTRGGQSVDALSGRFSSLSKEILVGQKTQADFARSLGRITGDAKGSIDAVKGLGIAALATGRTLEEQMDIGAGLRQGLGVVGDTTNALGKLRAQAEGVGTDWTNFADAIAASKGALEQVAQQADGTKDRVTALAAVLGKGFSREGQARVTGGVLGTLQGRALDIERMLGRRVLDDKGHLVDPAKDMKDIQARVFKRLGQGSEASRRALISSFGAEAGSAIFGYDPNKVDELANAKSAAGKTAAEAAAFKASPAGQLIRHDVARENAEIQTGRGLNAAKQGLWGWATGLLEDHPVAGLLGLSGGQAVAQAGLQGVLRGGAKAAASGAVEGGAAVASAAGKAAAPVAEVAMTQAEAKAALAAAEAFGKTGASYAAKGIAGKALSYIPVAGQVYETAKFQYDAINSLGRDSEFAKDRRAQLASASAQEIGQEAIRRGRLTPELYGKAGTVEGGQAELIKYLSKIPDLPRDLAEQIANALEERDRRNAPLSPAQQTEIVKATTPKP